MNQATGGFEWTGGVLGREQIAARLDDIFMPDTWDTASVAESVYELRVAADFMIVGGERYYAGDRVQVPFVHIKPGERALLSTVEAFQMPYDLAGRLGIKFKFTRRGLVPMFGATVDPWYGRRGDTTPYQNARLYLVVCNLGHESIPIPIGERVFTLELHTVVGGTRPSGGDIQPRVYQREVISERFFSPEESDSARPGFIQKVDEDLKLASDKTDKNVAELNKLRIEVGGINEGFRNIVFFGVFLIASALLAGSISALFAMIFAVDPGRGSTLTTALSTSAVRILLFVVAVLLAGSMLGLVGAAIVYIVRQSSSKIT